MSFSKRFSKLSHLFSDFSGRPGATILACAVVLVWLITGPFFEFSDTWQLVINTGTTIVTFIMVFLIQNSQNRDSQATQIKLDELIRTNEGAHKALLDLEELTQEELDHLKHRYESLAKKARADLKSGIMDTERMEI